MKKVLIAACVLFAVSNVQASDIYVPTGVMAVYPGVANEPFSAPIDNRLKYANKPECEKALSEIAKSHVIYVSTDNGAQSDQQTSDGSIVVVAGTCGFLADS